MIRSWAIELAGQGVTANVIAPGALTRMTEDLGIPDEAQKSMDPRWVAPRWPAST